MKVLRSKEEVLKLTDGIMVLSRLVGYEKPSVKGDWLWVGWSAPEHWTHGGHEIALPQLLDIGWKFSKTKNKWYHSCDHPITKGKPYARTKGALTKKELMELLDRVTIEAVGGTNIMVNLDGTKITTVASGSRLSTVVANAESTERADLDEKKDDPAALLDLIDD